MRVLVPAGTVLFYNHNILHRATYPTSPERGNEKNDLHLTDSFSDVTWLHVVCNARWTRQGSRDTPTRFSLDEKYEIGRGNACFRNEKSLGEYGGEIGSK